MRALKIYLLIMGIALCGSLLYAGLRKTVHKTRLKSIHMTSFDQKTELNLQYTRLRAPVANLAVSADFYDPMIISGITQPDSIMK